MGYYYKGEKWNREQDELDDKKQVEIKCEKCGNPFCVTNSICYSCGIKTPTKRRLKMKVLNMMLIVGILLLVSGCADYASFTQAAKMDSVGFWYGLWHGIILPISWIVSLFSDSTSIYAIYNNGGWYDFGFVLGCGALAGGASST